MVRNIVDLKGRALCRYIVVVLMSVVLSAVLLGCAAATEPPIVQDVLDADAVDIILEEVHTAPTEQEIQISAMTVDEAQASLSKWGCLPGFCLPEGCLKTNHALDLDKQEEGVIVYGFVIDLPSLSSSSSDHNAYAWVNSVTGEIRFEEAGFSLVTGRNYYANIPDSIFPIPMRDGEVIPYDRFNPSGHGLLVGYGFSDICVMEIYKEQLRSAGFSDLGRVMSVDWLWRYDRESDGATFIVEMYLESQFVMTMSVEFLNH